MNWIKCTKCDCNHKFVLENTKNGEYEYLSLCKKCFFSSFNFVPITEQIIFDDELPKD